MIVDRVDSLPPKIRLTPDDIVPGVSFKTQRKGHEPEELVFIGTGLGVDRRGKERYEARLFNPATAKDVVTPFSSLVKGEVGMSRVIEMSPREGDGYALVGEEPSQRGGVLLELGTDMVIVSQKTEAGAKGEEIFTIISRVEDGNVVLESPERPGRQMFRVPETDLLRRESDALNLIPVDPKFSLLKDAPRLGRVLDSREVPDPKEYLPGKVSGTTTASRDVRAGDIIGGLRPERSMADVLQNPNGVLDEAIDTAARRMLLVDGGKDSVRELVLLLALKGGQLARLPIMRRGR